MKTNATFRIERFGDVVSVTPLVDLGELKLDLIREDAQDVLDGLEKSATKYLVIDCCEIDYFGSTALAFFLRLWSKIRSRNGRLAVCNLSDCEREVLSVTRLNRLWTLKDTRSEALQSFHTGLT